MPRSDLAATINQVTFQPEVWEWLDVLDDMVAETQNQAMIHDKFLADTSYKQLLVRAIQRDLSTLFTVYALLRFELIHQAAAHVRLFCESIITLNFICRDTERRVPQFLDYAKVEAYEMTKSALAWEREHAQPSHLARTQSLLSQLEGDYESTKKLYVFTSRKGRQQPFRNWCNISIADQARQCGARLERLYGIVYSQLSAYVHGSAWSLGRQMAYSKKYYDPRVILIDISTIVRTLLVVWEEWARFCDEQVGWALTSKVIETATRLDALDTRHFS